MARGWSGHGEALSTAQRNQLMRTANEELKSYGPEDIEALRKKARLMVPEKRERIEADIADRARFHHLRANGPEAGNCIVVTKEWVRSSCKEIFAILCNLGFPFADFCCLAA